MQVADGGEINKMGIIEVATKTKTCATGGIIEL
jgi:hypothetical protein